MSKQDKEYIVSTVDQEGLDYAIIENMLDPDEIEDKQLADLIRQVREPLKQIDDIINTWAEDFEE